MAVSENTRAAKSLCDILKSLGKNFGKVGMKLAKNVLPNPTRALDIIANIDTAAGRFPKNVLSTIPELIDFYITGKGLCVGKLV